MRCDLPRIPRNARSLLCATKASATDQSTLPPRPDGTTRLPSRRPRALRGGGSAQPIKGCSSEISARDSLRPRVVKANPSACGRGQLIADGARRRPRAGSRCHSARRSPGRRLSRASCQAFCRWRLTQTDGLWVALEHPFCVSGCNPTVLTHERRRRVTASSYRKFVHSCWSA